MKPGQRLFTKDGRVIGNAIITETRIDPRYGFQARFETDFGNGHSWLSQKEIEAWWWTHSIDGAICISDVAEWRKDREEARQKRIIDEQNPH